MTLCYIAYKAVQDMLHEDDQEQIAHDEIATLKTFFKEITDIIRHLTKLEIYAQVHWEIITELTRQSRALILGASTLLKQSGQTADFFDKLLQCEDMMVKILQELEEYRSPH